MRTVTTFAFVVSVLAAVHAQSHPVKDSHPSLRETLQWMHNAFPDSRSFSEFSLGQTREFNFAVPPNSETPACTVTIVDHWVDGGKRKTRDTIINLSLVDPESIKWNTDDTLHKDTGQLVMVSTDDKKTIVTKMEKEDTKPYLTQRVFISFLGPEYAERFAKAFKNAVILCGGKPSTF